MIDTECVHGFSYDGNNTEMNQTWNSSTTLGHCFKDWQELCCYISYQYIFYYIQVIYTKFSSTYSSGVIKIRVLYLGG
jgi:hypothetical protein